MRPITNSLPECPKSEFTNGAHAWGPNGQCSFCGVALTPSSGVAVARPTLTDDRATIQRLAEALKDAMSGLRYILERYGELDGVGWQRVEEKGSAALREAGVDT